MNGHLMGFFPHHWFPPKRNPKEAPSPRRGLFSLIHVAREKVLGAAGPMLRRDIRYRGLAGAVVESSEVALCLPPFSSLPLGFRHGIAPD